MKKFGIYKFTNIINNKIYIGSSSNLVKRQRDHLNLNIKSGCTLFRKAVKKYRTNSFKFEVIEYVDNREDLIIREQYYLNMLLKADLYLKGQCDYFIKKGYNLSPTASSRKGIKEINSSYKFKKIIEYDINGNFIRIWDSIKEASKFYNISESRISHSCIKEQRGKYIFRYYINNYPLKINFKTKNIRKTISEDIKIKISNALKGRKSLLKKKVKQLDLQGNIINIFPSITEAGIATNIGKTSIRNVINGRTKTAGK